MIGFCELINTQHIICIISSIYGKKSVIILFKIPSVFNLTKTLSVWNVCILKLAMLYVCITSSSLY